MSKFQAYIESFRLRTLPLSLSGVILGILLAKANGFFQLWPCVFALTTTLCLQILSNLANEWGDLQKGTDNQERIGPIRSIQSGALTMQEFKRMIILFVVLSGLSGLILVYFAFDSIFKPDGLIMLALGALSIIAAIKYTVGKNAYGYRGLGDLFVFLFFGLLSVCGSYFIMAHSLNAEIFLPAAAIGMLATGVLNLNNMRDIENDAQCGKRTVPVMIGLDKAKFYHCFLVIGSLLLFLIYAELNCHALHHLHTMSNSGIFTNYTLCTNFMFLIAAPIMALHLRRVFGTEGRALDSQLKVLSLSTLLVAVLFGIGQIL